MSLDLQLAILAAGFILGFFAGTVRGWNASGARTLAAAKDSGGIAIDGVRLLVFREIDCEIVEQPEGYSEEYPGKS